MKEVAQLLNAMRESGAIADYPLFGAAAQMRYAEPVAALNAEVLVEVPSPEALDPLAAVRVGAWPVQFIPVFSPLTREALKEAQTADYEGVPLRVVRADHLAVIALSVGRAKDFTRILGLLESGSVTRGQVARLAARHGLSDAWQCFEARFPNEF